LTLENKDTKFIILFYNYNPKESKMKKTFASAIALVMTAPAHAISIISLHGAPTASQGAPMASASVETVIVITSLITLAGVISYRVFKRKTK
jgi:hypothetical protein